MSSYSDQILLHQFKQLQARLNQEQTVIDTLKLHNQQLTHEIQGNKRMYDDLKIENQQLKSSLEDVRAQLAARKKSSETLILELRADVNRITEKNIKMVEIVHMLETNLEQKSNYIIRYKCQEEGLRKTINQLNQQTNNLRTKSAKTEVASEKYKLKALEGEKYWTAKIQSLKEKHTSNIYDISKQVQSKFVNQISSLTTQLQRLNRIITAKQNQIRSLENKFSQFFINGDQIK